MDDGQDIKSAVSLKTTFADVAPNNGIQIAAATPQAMTPSQMMGGTKLPATPANAAKIGLS